MKTHSPVFGWRLWSVLVLLGGFVIWSCSTGESPVAQNDIPGVVFAARSVGAMGDPLDPIRFQAGGDLMTLVPGTPSGTLRNLTSDLTNGVGDVSDPEIFLQTTGSRGERGRHSGQCAGTAHVRIVQ
jgi:hypothetical protein